MRTIKQWMDEHENGENPDPLTWRETMAPAMEVETREDADAYLDQLLSYMAVQRPEKDRGELKEIALSNIGYWSGYYDKATMVRVYKVFGAAHPIFGAVDESTEFPSPEEIVEMGKSLAEEQKEQ